MAQRFPSSKPAKQPGSPTSAVETEIRVVLACQPRAAAEMALAQALARLAAQALWAAESNGSECDTATADKEPDHGL